MQRIRYMMSSHINTLLRQAVFTFGDVKERLPQNLVKLKELLDQTQAADVGFKEHELLSTEIWTKPGKAPVSYVDVYEDDLVSMGVFVLRPGMKLPLHDHPQMYGMIKVLAGSMQISSYSVESVVSGGNSVIANQHKPVTVHHIDKSSMLDPTKQNLHEIESVDGPVAFLDILSPPYDTELPSGSKRKCTYYQPVQQVAVNKLKLNVIECPSWYWCDEHRYQGPEIVEEEIFGKQEGEMR